MRILRTPIAEDFVFRDLYLLWQALWTASTSQVCSAAKGDQSEGTMSHHLDSPLARQDVRLDITDLYVFRGEIGTVFVMPVIR